jgi:diacylglycerol kinase (ATP)
VPGARRCAIQENAQPFLLTIIAPFGGGARAAGASTGAVTAPTRLFVVLNPHAGRGGAAAAWAAAEPILRAAGCSPQLVESKRPGHARELLAALPPGACDAVVVAGGDGSLHEAIDGLMAAGTPRPPLGLIPAGTGNSLATDLECLDPQRAARAIVDGRTRPLDVMKVRLGPAGGGGAGAIGTSAGDGATPEPRTLYAFNIVGWGLAADAGARAQWLRRRAPWLGSRRYAVANLLELLRRRVRSARLRLLTSDDTEERLEGRYVMALACNTQHTGAGMRIAPRARFDDGLLDLIIVPQLSRARLLALLGMIPSGRHLEAPELRYRQVSEFELAARSGGRPGRDTWCLNVDGEILRETHAPVLEVSVQRGALKLLCS